MSVVREMRERQIVPQSAERSGLLATILIGVVAFGVGVGGIVAWKWWPSSKAPQVAASAPTPSAPTFTGIRLGRAATAPLLRTCVRGEIFQAFGAANPEAVYGMMTAAGTMSRLAPLVGAEAGDGAQLTEYWREIADCVFQQNSWNLCDADNRALAVESVSGFIRGAARIAASPPKTRDAQMILNDNARVRQRVLDVLRSRIRSGHVIEADFGALAPPEIKALLKENRTTGDGCAKS